jgi:gamma-glutamyl-gamma-aminobutyrate hydrolase PuuD
LSQKTYNSMDDWGGQGTMEWLLDRHGLQRVPSPFEADVIVFNGGADIASSIYGEPSIGWGIPDHPSRRDLDEISVFQQTKGSYHLLLGICRGAQLLNCLNGGSLWQDVNNHHHSHRMTDVRTGKEYRTTSTHHQMMIPKMDECELIAVSSESTVKRNAQGMFNFHPDKHMGTDGKDVEIVWYPMTNSLCIQGHPEYVPGTEFAHYCLDLMDHYLEEILRVAA